MNDMQILRHTEGKSKHHLVGISKEGWKTLYALLWLGLTCKGEVAIVSGMRIVLKERLMEGRRCRMKSRMCW